MTNIGRATWHLPLNYTLFKLMRFDNNQVRSWYQAFPKAREKKINLLNRY